MRGRGRAHRPTAPGARPHRAADPSAAPAGHLGHPPAGRAGRSAAPVAPANQPPFAL